MLHLDHTYELICEPEAGLPSKAMEQVQVFHFLSTLVESNTKET